MLKQGLMAVVYLLVIVAVRVNAQSLPDFTILAETQSPAVVKIQTETKTSIPAIAGLPPGQEVPEVFRHLFQLPQQMPDQMQQSMGSGFIVDTNGYVVTNNHVIRDADRITVRLNDRREFEATLVGTDERSDIALLKIDAKGLPVVRFADNNTTLKVGEWVMAIGSPFGLDYSVAVGVVSAIGRSIPNENNENYVPFIQTDVAINPGNSGGPLFNLDGKVVGINSQIFTRSGGSMGLSFAIPSNVALSVIRQLKQDGHVTRGWLGVAIQEVDKTLASSFGLTKPSGALVADVVPDSPAQHAGIRIGDIILKLNDQDILYSEELPHIVGEIRPGEPVTLSLMREGKTQLLDVVVGALPEDKGAPVANAGKKTGKGDRLGLVVGELKPEQKRQLGINAGVMVLEVRPGSPAAETGLMPGDVITQLGFDPVISPADFASKVEVLERGSLQPIRFYREGRPIFRTIVTE